MPIPDYQSIMLPLMNEVADRNVYLLKDVIDALSKKFKLSDEETNELLPSGQAFLFSNRVGWARTYLKKAGLLEAPKRGSLAITQRGADVLKTKPSKIDNNLLKQFPEFLTFQNLKKEDIDVPPSSESISENNR